MKDDKPLGGKLFDLLRFLPFGAPELSQGYYARCEEDSDCDADLDFCAEHIEARLVELEEKTGKKWIAIPSAPSETDRVPSCYSCDKYLDHDGLSNYADEQTISMLEDRYTTSFPKPTDVAAHELESVVGSPIIDPALRRRLTYWLVDVLWNDEIAEAFKRAVEAAQTQEDTQP
jgi:hypothetical protein